MPRQARHGSNAEVGQGSKDDAEDDYERIMDDLTVRFTN